MSFAPGIRLELRQQQSLVLTPQLQQAIRLLQMSNLELAGAIDHEVAENPFLQRSDREVAPALANGAAAPAAMNGAAPVPAADSVSSRISAASLTRNRLSRSSDPQSMKKARCNIAVAERTP